MEYQPIEARHDLTPLLWGCVHGLEDLFLSPHHPPKTKPSTVNWPHKWTEETYQKLLKSLLGQTDMRALSRIGYSDGVRPIPSIFGGGILRFHACLIRHGTVIREELSIRFCKFYGQTLAARSDEQRIIVGATGSGKTTLMVGRLHAAIQKNTRVLLVEDEPEIELMLGQLIPVAPFVKNKIEDMALSILRRRPDIIAIGEIRSEELARFAVNLLQTGHGVLASMHAGSRLEAQERLYLLTGFKVANSVIFESISR